MPLPRAFGFLPRSMASRVALTYAGLAALWILFSDRALGWAVADPVWHLRLSVAKGWFFVTVTALMLFAYLKVQADNRLALLEATRRARVVPWRWDAATGRWTFERSVEAVLGLDPAELAAPGGVERAFHPEDLHRLAGARHRAARGGLESFDARMLAGTGRELWTQWTIKATAGGLQGVLQDVSELHEVRAQLIQHQRRELAQQLSGGVNHDLKNLLQAILGSAELLALNPRTDSESRSVHTIIRASERAHELLQQMLGLVRPQPERPGEPGELGDLVQECVDLLRHALPVGVDLRFEPPAQGLRGRFDSGQILQLLMNLGLNARDAVGPQGWIRIQVSQEGEPTQGGDLVVEVSDSGPGVPEALRERLFEPFFTTKPEGAGTGLGLAMAKAIAEAHGGSLSCLSAPGEGARFRLTLPAIPASAAP
ncbi:MAG TPA: HAMP domain-containing sensor histidine kinase [Holophagaceae bacterium]|nr:HAMP domain-containing sensor histidine kinase [Holophagaceae bacterium]